MLKRSALLVLLLALIAMAAIPAQAQFKDDDGQLTAIWETPACLTSVPPTCNPLKNYELWYYTNISGVVDSLQVFTTDLSDSSIILPNVGDYAWYRIRSVSVVDDYSAWVTSDTAYFDLGTGIDPPAGVTWTD